MIIVEFPKNTPQISFIDINGTIDIKPWLYNCIFTNKPTSEWSSSSGCKLRSLPGLLKSELLRQMKLYLSKKNHVTCVWDTTETPMQAITTTWSFFDIVVDLWDSSLRCERVVISNILNCVPLTVLSTNGSLDLFYSTLLPLDNGVVLTQLILLIIITYIQNKSIAVDYRQGPIHHFHSYRRKSFITFISFSFLTSSFSH